MSSKWSRLSTDDSHGGCASSNCFWPAVWRWLSGGVGSKYCEACKTRTIGVTENVD